MRDHFLPHHGPEFHLPILEWVQGYQKSWIKPDVVAGVTAAAVVLPEAMAYATAEKKYREQKIAVWLLGMSPEVFAAVEKTPLGKTLEHERMFLNLEQALAAMHDLSCKQDDASSNQPTSI